MEVLATSRTPKNQILSSDMSISSSLSLDKSTDILKSNVMVSTLSFHFRLIQDEDEGSGFLDKIADVVKDGIEEVKEAVEDVIGNDEDEDQVWP